MTNGTEPRTLEGFLAAFAIAAFLVIAAINAHGNPEFELDVTAAVAAESGYEPVPEDYHIAAYRHGLPFVYMRRHGGSGEADMGSLPVARNDLAVTDFSRRSSAWPIDNAPLKSWSFIALGGNLALACVLAGGMFLIGRLILRRPLSSSRDGNIPLRRLTVFGTGAVAFVIAVGLSFGVFDHHAPEPVVFASVEANQLPKSPPTTSDLTKPSDPNIRNDNSLGMELRWCEPGTFASGNRTIIVEQGYWIGRNEITQAEYRHVMDQNPSFCQDAPLSPYAWGILVDEELTPSLIAFKENQRRELVKGLNTDRFPVETVSWEEAVEFCHRLTAVERAEGRITENWAYQLPTEKQWEHACRAGTSTATAFGESLSLEEANFAGDSPSEESTGATPPMRPTIVRSYPSNRWGLFDFHGNVHEWCRDSYHQKPFSESHSTSMTLRGGSFAVDTSDCTATSRSSMERSQRSPDTGFRIVLANTHIAVRPNGK